MTEMEQLIAALRLAARSHRNCWQHSTTEQQRMANYVEPLADNLERALSKGDGPLVLDRETGEVRTT